MSREEGVITADILFGLIADEPEQYRTAELAEATYRQWQSDLKTGRQYYLSKTLPCVKGLFDRPAEKGRR
jgi:hypothetical protein